MSLSHDGQGNRFRRDLENSWGRSAATNDAFIPDLDGADGINDYDYEALWICYSDENIATASGKMNPMLDGLDWTGCIDWDEEEAPLGTGSFGTVYQGVWEPIKHLSVLPPGIVVKVMRPLMDGNEQEKANRMKELKKEVEIWQNLRHKNIVPFIGFVRTLSGLPALISEYMPNGTVFSYIRNHPSTEHRNEFMLGVAEGLHYLHSQTPKIVHGDLKADNVMLDDKLNPRFTDFGLNRMMATSTLWATSTKSVGGTTRWMAPELLNQDEAKTSPASDIYALGMTFLEIMTGKHPYYDMPEGAVLGAKYSCELPKIPEHPEIPLDLLDFWDKCWHTSPIMRPDSEIVVEFLKDFVNRGASSIHDEESSTGRENEIRAGNHRIREVPRSDGSMSSPSPLRLPKLEPPRVPSRQDGRLSRNASRRSETHEPEFLGAGNQRTRQSRSRENSVPPLSMPPPSPLRLPKHEHSRTPSRQDGRLSRNTSRLGEAREPEFLGAGNQRTRGSRSRENSVPPLSIPPPSPLRHPRHEHPRVPSRQDGRLSRNAMRYNEVSGPRGPRTSIPGHVPNTFFADLNWDLTQSPRPLLDSGNFDPKSSAFIPPLKKCKVICKGTPWKFEVKARKQQPHITISSLLNDISSQLLTTVDIEVYRGHRSSEKRDQIMHIYLERCNGLPSHEERMAALSDWILRVDYFLAGTKFAALEPSPRGPTVFDLVTAAL